MNRYMMSAASLVTLAALMTGCGSNTYQPKMSDTELSAAAGKNAYSYNGQAEMAPSIFAEIQGNGVITLYNAGDESYVDFTVWVNKTYSLQVDKLLSRTKISLSPDHFYNSVGSKMGSVPAGSITKIQIFNKDKMWDVKGPIQPNP